MTTTQPTQNLYILLSYCDDGPEDAFTFYASSKLQVVEHVLEEIQKYAQTGNGSQGEQYVTMLESMGGAREPLYPGQRQNGLLAFAGKVAALDPTHVLQAIENSYHDGDSSLTVMIIEKPPTIKNLN